MSYYDREYTTVTDARTALISSGVLEWFDANADTYEIAEWIWRNHATPAQAAKHFGVA